MFIYSYMYIFLSLSIYEWADLDHIPDEAWGGVEEVDGGPPVRDQGRLQSQGLQQLHLKIIMITSLYTFTQ